MYRCRDLTEVGSFIVFKNMSILSSSGATPFEVMLLPRWSTCWCPNAHLDIDSLWPAVWICLKTVSMFDNSLSTLCAAMPMSSTYWAPLLAFTIASTYSRTVLLREIGWVPVPVAGWRRFGPRSWTVVVALIARPPFEGNAMPASNSTQKSTSFLPYAGRRRGFYWMIMLVIVIFQEMVDSAQVYQDSKLPIGFALGKCGQRVLAVWQRRDDAVLLHQCQFDE